MRLGTGQDARRQQTWKQRNNEAVGLFHRDPRSSLRVPIFQMMRTVQGRPPWSEAGVGKGRGLGGVGGRGALGPRPALPPLTYLMEYLETTHHTQEQ